jgi:DNA-binding CsgD family transcriptional regulator
MRPGPGLTAPSAIARGFALSSTVVRLPLPDHSHDRFAPLERVAIAAPGDIRRAADILDGIVRARGLRAMLWHDISSGEAMVDARGEALNRAVFCHDATSLARLWEDHAFALNSQIFRASRVENEPFWINRRGIHARLPNPSFTGIGVRDFEQRSLVRAAIVVPLHMPFSQIGLAVFTSLDPARDDLAAEFGQSAKLLAEISRRFVDGYVKVMGDNPYLPAECVLGPRELQCLRWIAFGKTDYEIAIILGCSNATVRYHIKRIYHKLDANNRAQAVFRACQLGFLGSVR